VLTNVSRVRKLNEVGQLLKNKCVEIVKDTWSTQPILFNQYFAIGTIFAKIETSQYIADLVPYRNDHSLLQRFVESREQYDEPDSLPLIRWTVEDGMLYANISPSYQLCEFEFKKDKYWPFYYFSAVWAVSGSTNREYVVITSTKMYCWRTYEFVDSAEPLELIFQLDQAMQNRKRHLLPFLCNVVLIEIGKIVLGYEDGFL
jgi:hypothetical protein